MPEFFNRFKGRQDLFEYAKVSCSGATDSTTIWNIFFFELICIPKQLVLLIALFIGLTSLV